MANFETIHERIKYLVDKYADGKNTVFAQRLGVSEANIRSYIRGIMPKADILSKIVITYEVNAMWLLTGLGMEDLPNTVPGAPIFTATDTTVQTVLNQLHPYIQSKDAKIIQLSEEIGRLKERIAQLEREKNVGEESFQAVPRELSKSTVDL